MKIIGLEFKTYAGEDINLEKKYNVHKKYNVFAKWDVKQDTWKITHPVWHAIMREHTGTLTGLNRFIQYFNLQFLTLYAVVN